jgi:SAM-dependent methyltransferase
MARDRRDATQAIDHLKGEIEFRRKLSRQHVSGDMLLPDYYEKREHDAILQDRIDTTYTTMKQLEARGIALSPFLELGAERGQRALVLTNHFGATGAALDISFHQLAAMGHFARFFEMPTLPWRICCDANYLPFKNGSFPFIFSYAFLHHFPALEPILTEVHRVLANGYFYFAEEPFKRILKLKLYTQKSKIYSTAARRKSKYVALLESFISEPTSDEVEHGILENADITLREWIRALSVFDDYDVELSSLGNIKSRLNDRVRLANIPNFLLGGSIAGLCRKDAPVKDVPSDLAASLACPTCIRSSTVSDFEPPPLVEATDGFNCSACACHYPRKDEVVFLLPNAELQALYPNM